jgi:hypothetical protein
LNQEHRDIHTTSGADGSDKMVPAQYRESGFVDYLDRKTNWALRRAAYKRTSSASTRIVVVQLASIGSSSEGSDASFGKAKRPDGLKPPLQVAMPGPYRQTGSYASGAWIGKQRRDPRCQQCECAPAIRHGALHILTQRIAVDTYCHRERMVAEQINVGTNDQGAIGRDGIANIEPPLTCSGRSEVDGRSYQLPIPQRLAAQKSNGDRAGRVGPSMSFSTAKRAVSTVIGLD